MISRRTLLTAFVGLFQAASILQVEALYSNVPSLLSPSFPLASSWAYLDSLGDGDQYVDLEPDIQVDSNGVPWIIWIRTLRGSTDRPGIYWSRWSGDSWDPPQPALSNYDLGVFKPKFTFDSADTAWMVWNSWVGSNIWFTRAYQGTWEMASQVNPTSVGIEYYSPEVSTGGGEVWIIWVGELTVTALMFLHARGLLEVGPPR